MTPANYYQLPKAEFDSIFAKVPRLCVELIIRTPKGLLLTKRTIDPCKGQWHFPGGTLRFGETLTDAVQRVAQYELGIEVKINKLLGYLEYPQMNADGYKGWPVGVAFEVAIVSGEPRGSDQGEELGFFEEIPADTIVDQANFLKTIGY